MSSTTRTAPRPATTSADFRTEAEVETWHRGVFYYVTTCHELVDGRWEGFVSMRPVYTTPRSR